MPVITVVLDQEQVDRAEELAAALSKVYGVRVSRASIIRRAIMSYQPQDLKDHEQETTDHDTE
jgi:hypothetical protein